MAESKSKALREEFDGCRRVTSGISADSEARAASEVPNRHLRSSLALEPCEFEGHSFGHVGPRAHWQHERVDTAMKSKPSTACDQCTCH